MGQLDMTKGFIPFNMQPVGSFDNKLMHREFRPSQTYHNPTDFGYAGVPGPFTEAAVYEVNGYEFLQGRWDWPRANTQIVSAPAQPISKGTYDALMQNSTGVYLQGRTIGIVHQYSGGAPTTGIYTGYYAGNGEYEGCS